MRLLQEAAGRQTVCRQALAATQCELSCNLPPRLARVELRSAGLPARRASDHCMDSEFDDVEITRDVSRINKEAVICNKAALALVHARAGASCRSVSYRFVTLPPSELPLRHIPRLCCFAFF